MTEAQNRSEASWAAAPHTHIQGGVKRPGCPGCGETYGSVVTQEEWDAVRGLLDWHIHQEAEYRTVTLPVEGCKFCDYLYGSVE
jgi:hypothetical protein